MDRPAVIRGLWGNSLLTRRRTVRPQAFARVLEQVNKTGSRNDIVDAVYCFGDDNLQFLRESGFKNVKLLSRHSWASPRFRDDFSYRWDGYWIYGCSMGWHKLKILQAATQEFSSVLYMDMDVNQIRNIPADYWAEIKEGPPIKVPLSKQRAWHWAAGWRYSKRWGYPQYICKNGKEAAKCSSTSGFLYVGSKEIANHLMDVQKRNYFWLDHQVVSFTIDEMNGGWLGRDAYIEKGFNLRGLRYNRLLEPSPDPIWEIVE